MIKEKITQDEFNLLDKYGVSLKHVANLVERDGEYFLQFESYDDFSTYLIFDIVEDGMDNQDTVNDIGRELYAIHDRIYYE
ncbi:hypothetical protein JXA27_08050 [Aerococcaceae bacterium zg-B36]|uniref:hypothetical protein n=1 Tax=Aerococcaceae bacterium zg-252 TaxID=2796928 RepID=UPI001BD88CA1|nr:hypothetical protein [Aerococcaceae bacterium zg-B36]